jgi:hypothetical protein
MTEDQKYEWIKGDIGGKARAASAARTDGREYAGWSETPFMLDDDTVEIRCALLLCNRPY